MHVAGRELTRWTWQTFWWTPAPDAPPAPSSPVVASLRPPQLRGAARHSAMALSYPMLSPNEPYVGGTNHAPAVYVHNPCLEARSPPPTCPTPASIPRAVPPPTITESNPTA